MLYLHSFKMKCQYMCITIYSVGSACLLVGLLITAFWWDLYNYAVLKRLPLSENSDSFQLWTSTEVPLYLTVYLFNWTNAEESLARREKPKVQQVGPYVYRQEIYRKDFVWNDNDTLTYSTGQRFFFVPELSRGDPNVDTIITPNIIVLTLLNQISSLPGLIRWPSNASFKLTVEMLLRMKVYTERTVSEILFDGYDDFLLDTFNIPKKILKCIFTKLKNFPDRFPGYFPRNGTMEYTLNMYAGQTDLKKMGFIHAYNYETNSPIYKGSCGRVYHSSPGDFWPVDTTKNEQASLFIPDFCSSLQLKNVGEYKVDGVDGIRFEGTEITFDNGTVDSEKLCYCPDKDCSFKSGVRDVSPCVDAPIIVSFPHFYAADPDYLNEVDGLSPNKDLHAFHITLQKDYGVLLQGAIRLQINARLTIKSGFSFLGIGGNTYDIFLPILWFETSINLPSAMTDKIYFSFKTAPLVFNIIGPILLILGLVTLVMKIFSQITEPLY